MRPDPLPSPPVNPYEPPTASLGRGEPDDLDPEAVALRRRNLGHEAGLRWLAAVNFAGAGLDALFIAVISYYTFRAGGIWADLGPPSKLISLTDLFLATPALVVLHLVLGSGLRQFQPWAFRGQVILSGAALADFFRSWAVGWNQEHFEDFTIATAILTAIAQFAILHYLLGSKSQRIVAPDYREAVAATPDLRGRRSPTLAIGIIPFSIAAEWGLLMLANEISKRVAYLIGPVDFGS